MWFVAVAKFKGGLAHYKVSAENGQVYTVLLSRFDGKTELAPPANFILVRGENHWSGSIEDQGLLDQLGAVVDTRLKGRLHHNITQPVSSGRSGKAR